MSKPHAAFADTDAFADLPQTAPLEMPAQSLDSWTRSGPLPKHAKRIMIFRRGVLFIGAAILCACALSANIGEYLRNGVTPLEWAALVLFTPLLLGLSFLPLGGAGGEPPFVAPLATLAAAPLPVLAAVAGTSPDDMARRLAAAGLPGATASSSVLQLAGPDRKQQIRVLGQVLAAR